VGVADGDGPERAALDVAWPGWDREVGLVIVADGGARAAEGLGLAIDVVVGDGDSLGEDGLARLRTAGVEIRTAPVDKDETDTELALVEAVRRGAERVTILGALGGPRVDHALANVELLAHPALAGRPVAIVDPRARITLISAPAPEGGPVTRPLPGPAGATISLLPIGGEVRGITTSGLRYPLRNEALPLGPARGLSNVRVSGEASVVVESGRLLVIETPVTLGR
jgi:thiamine pyrophosphokinase